MSQLLTKSQENIEAARILMKNRKFASSVHCSYYSCLQNMKHLLFSDLEFTLAQIENETNGVSSHAWILNKIASALYLKDNILSSEIRQDFERIKNLRKKADYNNSLISSDEAESCFEIANNTNIKLNSTLSRT